MPFFCEYRVILKCGIHRHVCAKQVRYCATKTDASLNRIGAPKAQVPQTNSQTLLKGNFPNKVENEKRSEAFSPQHVTNAPRIKIATTKKFFTKDEVEKLRAKLDDDGPPIPIEKVAEVSSEEQTAFSPKTSARTFIELSDEEVNSLKEKLTLFDSQTDTNLIFAVVDRIVMYNHKDVDIWSIILEKLASSSLPYSDLSRRLQESFTYADHYLKSNLSGEDISKERRVSDLLPTLLELHDLGHLNGTRSDNSRRILASWILDSIITSISIGKLTIDEILRLKKVLTFSMCLTGIPKSLNTSLQQTLTRHYLIKKGFTSKLCSKRPKEILGDKSSCLEEQPQGNKKRWSDTSNDLSSIFEDLQSTEFDKSNIKLVLSLFVEDIEKRQLHDILALPKILTKFRIYEPHLFHAICTQLLKSPKKIFHDPKNLQFFINALRHYHLVIPSLPTPDILFISLFGLGTFPPVWNVNSNPFLDEPPTTLIKTTQAEFLFAALVPWYLISCPNEYRYQIKDVVYRLIHSCLNSPTALTMSHFYYPFSICLNKKGIQDKSIIVKVEEELSRRQKKYKKNNGTTESNKLSSAQQQHVIYSFQSYACLSYLTHERIFHDLYEVSMSQLKDLRGIQFHDEVFDKIVAWGLKVNPLHRKDFSLLTWDVFYKTTSASFHQKIETFLNRSFTSADDDDGKSQIANSMKQKPFLLPPAHVNALLLLSQLAICPRVLLALDLEKSPKDIMTTYNNSELLNHKNLIFELLERKVKIESSSVAINQICMLTHNLLNLGLPTPKHGLSASKRREVILEPFLHVLIDNFPNIHSSLLSPMIDHHSQFIADMITEYLFSDDSKSHVPKWTLETLSLDKLSGLYLNLFPCAQNIKLSDEIIGDLQFRAVELQKQLMGTGKAQSKRLEISPNLVQTVWELALGQESKMDWYCLASNDDQIAAAALATTNESLTADDENLEGGMRYDVTFDSIPYESEGAKRLKLQLWKIVNTLETAANNLSDIRFNWVFSYQKAVESQNNENNTEQQPDVVVQVKALHLNLLNRITNLAVLMSQIVARLKVQRGDDHQIKSFKSKKISHMMHELMSNDKGRVDKEEWDCDKIRKLPHFKQFGKKR